VGLDLPDLSLAEPLMAVKPERSELREITVRRREYELLEKRLSQCSDFKDHLLAQRQFERVERRISEVKTKVKSQAESLARQFDRVLAIWPDEDFWVGGC
jgi:hypothetical protein